jgi:hypothetical protein
MLKFYCLLILSLFVSQSESFCIIGYPNENLKEVLINSATLKIIGPLDWVPRDVSNVIVEFNPPLQINVDYIVRSSKYTIPEKFISKPHHTVLTLILLKGRRWIKEHFVGKMPLTVTNIYCGDGPKWDVGKFIQVATIVNKRITCPTIPFLPDSTPPFVKALRDILQACQSPKIIKSGMLGEKHVRSINLLELQPPIVLVDASDQPLLEAAKDVDHFLARHSVLDVVWEPMDETEPKWWILMPKPHGLPGHVFALLDILQWEHPFVMHADEYNIANGNCTRDIPACVPGCPKSAVQTIAPSGYAAVAHFLIQGFQRAIHYNVPFQIAPLTLSQRSTPPLWGGVEGWIYTFEGCSSHFLDCYFLDHSPCPKIKFDVERPGVSGFDSNRHYPRYGSESAYNSEPYWWRGLVGHGTADIPERTILSYMYQYTHSGHLLYSYFFRPNYNLRRKIYEGMKAFNSKEVLGGEGNPCAVMHVRRGDILLHDGQSRFFLSVANYVHAGRYYLDEFGIKTIFLLTDSQMAIDEALRCEKEYPEICAGINWRYLDKKRWLAGEGGWENPFPSGSSVEELYNIQLEFALAQSCEFTIFGESGYSERVYIY